MLTGLSAWTSFNEKERYKVILDAHEDKTVKYRIHGYLVPRKEQGAEPEKPQEGTDG